MVDPIETIRTRLEDTLFVEAGAGTGKTFALVERVVATVLSGGACMREIAAITFTEAAAAELQERVRNRFAELAADMGIDEGIRSRCAAALAELHEASISTLHSFARRILAEHPLDAGLPPIFDVMDEVASGMDLDACWNELCLRFYSDDSREQLATRAIALGVRIESLYDIARLMRDNWDRLRGEGWGDIDVGDRRNGEPLFGGTEWEADQETLIEIFEPSRSIAISIDSALSMRERCSNGDDRMLLHLDSLAAQLGSLKRAIDSQDETAVLETLGSSSLLTGVGRHGQQKNWGAPALAEVREALNDVSERCTSLISAVASQCLCRFVRIAAAFTLDTAEGRRREGKLDFHDLLVFAVDLVKSNSRVRRLLSSRWRALLIDEFQDTDPLQIELAMLLAEDGISGTPEPGRLFFVGDPKQSIYRFRRADIVAYEHAKRSVDHVPVPLTVNRRSVPAVLSWVNTVCAVLIGDGVPGRQPAYVPLVPLVPLTETGSSTMPDAGPGVVVPLDSDVASEISTNPQETIGPGVATLGGPAETTLVEVRRQEAADIAAVCVAAISQGWMVRERSGGKSSWQSWRSARFGDIAVLVPNRALLPELGRCLEEAGVPYQLESSSLTMATQEVRDLVSVLRAIDNPVDGLAVVAALRTPGLACSDLHLTEFREAGGAWNLLAPIPSSILPNHPVRAAIEELRSFSDTAWGEGVSGMVGRVIRRLRLFELALANPDPAEAWKRLRFVLDLSRSFAESRVGSSLREFVRWLDPQLSGRVTLADTALDGGGILPGTGGAVRIMTVHAAKGLEFPITVVAGLSASLVSRSTRRFVWGTGCLPEASMPISVEGAGGSGKGPGANGNRGFARTFRYEEAASFESEMEVHEKLRLAYVAMTRARDHLVVSLHHSTGPRSSPSLASQIYEVCEGMTDGLFRRFESFAYVPVDCDHRERTWRRTRPPRAGASASERSDWLERRQELLHRHGRAPVVSATGVAEALSTGSDVSIPARSTPGTANRTPARSTPGTANRTPAHSIVSGQAVGKAVHAALQAVDLAQAVDLVGAGGKAHVLATARRFAEAEHIGTQTDRVAGFVKSALRSSEVRRAVEAGRYWRELYVAAPLGGTLLEGYIDLLVEDVDGELYVVDYKTDDVSTESRMEELARRYRFQCACYAAALGETLGKQVAQATLVFLDPDGGPPKERPIENLTAEIQEIRRFMAAAEVRA